jgi:hypothetical protein
MTTPLTYTPRQAAERIGAAVTEDWLKKRAAADAIPHTRSGKGRGRSGRIAFTEAHLAEILQLIEHRPEGTPAPAAPEQFTSVVSRGKRTA